MPANGFAMSMMNRPAKPGLIRRHLAANGVHAGHLRAMLSEPLPDAIRRELEELARD